MSFPAYPKYRSSRVVWLGEIPLHWTTISLKRMVDPARPITYGIVQAGPHEEEGIAYIRPTDMTDECGVLSISSLPRTSEDIARSYSRSSLKQGDIICSIGPSFGKVMEVPAELEGANLTQGTARVAAKKGVDPRFIFWCLRSKPSYEQWESSVGGATFRALNLEPLARTCIALPPREDQVAIAAFLDRETAKIDALVEEQRRLIALLKEKRQAVISHAVTKGLNPDAPMKDSGIEWLGKVPAHWVVTAAGRYLQILSGFAFPSESFSTDPEHARLLRGVNVGVGRIRWEETVYWPRSPGDGLSAFALSEGELVIGMDRPWIAEGVRIAKLCASDLPCLLLQRVAALRPTERLDVDYLHLLLSSPAFVDYFTPDMTGVSVPHLSPGQINAFPIPLPPPSEQRAIVAHVRLRATAADQLIAAAEEAMELLGERRSALISAAVTGKIDVRGSAEVLQFPIGRAHARGLIGAEIIEHLAHQATFGRVKLQKIAYLAEAHAGVTELEGGYVREAAGPLDRQMIRDMEREAGALTGMRVDQPDGAGSAVTYRHGDRRGAHRQGLAALLGERAVKFDRLIEDIGTIDTKGAEAVATLFAVWNDALIDGETPQDMEIKLAVLSEWHPEKAQRFRIDELQIWLDWMRRHRIVPTGTGPKTSTGRLFA